MIGETYIFYLSFFEQSVDIGCGACVTLNTLCGVGDPVLIDLMSCKILFLHRDQPILGMNFQLFVSFAQMAAAQTVCDYYFS